VKDRPYFQEIFQFTESTLHLLELLVGPHHLGGGELFFVYVGFQEKLSVQKSFLLPDLGVDIEDEFTVLDLRIEVLAHVVLFDCFDDSVVQVKVLEPALLELLFGLHVSGEFYPKSA